MPMPTPAWPAVGSTAWGPIVQDLLARVAQGNVMWVIGDSIMAGSSVMNGVQGTQFAPNSPFAWVSLLSNQRMNVQGFLGGSGHRTADAANTFVPQIVAMSPRPSACLIMVGSNDVSNAVPLATSAANLTSAYSQLLAAGIAPIVATIPPLNSFPAGVSLLNSWITRYAELNGFGYVDCFSAIVNSTTGAIAAAYDSGDGIHPNAAGAKAMGQAIITAGAHTVLPPWSPPLVGSNADTNGASNPCLINNTANVPTGWVLQTGAGTYTLAADVGNVLGNAWGITQSAGTVSFDSPAITAAAGDKVALACRYQCTVKSVGGNGDVWLRAGSDGTGIFRPLTTWTEDLGWQTIYCEGLVPAGKTNAKTTITIAGAVNAVHKIAQFTMLNLTALGLS